MSMSRLAVKKWPWGCENVEATLLAMFEVRVYVDGGIKG